MGLRRVQSRTEITKSLSQIYEEMGFAPLSSLIQSLFTGNTAERPSLPLQGDVYIDYEAPAIFVCDTDGTWTNSMTISRLSAGSITVAGTLGAGGSWGTASSGARTILDSTGIHGDDASAPRYVISNDGRGWL